MRVNTLGLEPHPGGQDCPRVQGVWPHCKIRSLYLGPAGVVTCAVETCVDPYAAAELLDGHGVPRQVEALDLGIAS